MGRPKAAKSLRVGLEKTSRCSFNAGNISAKDPYPERTFRSSTEDPIAMAACGVGSAEELMIPNGILARENGVSGDMSGIHVNAMV